MISDVGELIANVDYVDGTVGAFRYQEVVFQGDMLLAEYEAALQLASELFVGDETVIEVTNYRSFPPSVVEPLTGLPDFVMETCPVPNFTDCEGGSIFKGSVENGHVEVWRTELVWIR